MALPSFFEPDEVCPFFILFQPSAVFRSRIWLLVVHDSSSTTFERNTLALRWVVRQIGIKSTACFRADAFGACPPNFPGTALKDLYLKRTVYICFATYLKPHFWTIHFFSWRCRVSLHLTSFNAYGTVHHPTPSQVILRSLRPALRKSKQRLQSQCKGDWPHQPPLEQQGNLKVFFALKVFALISLILHGKWTETSPSPRMPTRVHRCVWKVVY